MALSVISTPRKTVNSYDSDAAATSQLRFQFREDDLGTYTNYKLKITIAALSNLVLYYFPDASGYFTFDVGKILEQGMSGNYLLFKLDYQGVYDAGATSAADTIEILAVRSRLQPGQANGSNMYVWTAKPTYLGKFLTYFDIPKFWNGWRNVVEFIKMHYTQVDFEFTALDINQTAIGTPDADTSLSGANTIANMALTYPSDTGAEYLKVQGSSTAPALVTEAKIYKLEPECSQPIMLEWVNDLGGQEIYLFSREQSFLQQADPGQSWVTPISADIGTFAGNKGRKPGKSIQYMTLKTGLLTKNELQALHEIRTSPFVYVWLDKTGATKVKVIVSNSFDTTFTSGKGNYEYSVTVEFPDNYDIYKALTY